jgi:hypothetical protein
VVLRRQRFSRAPLRCCRMTRTPRSGTRHWFGGALGPFQPYGRGRALAGKNFRSKSRGAQEGRLAPSRRHHSSQDGAKGPQSNQTEAGECLRWLVVTRTPAL